MSPLLSGVRVGDCVYAAGRVHGGSEEPLGGVVLDTFDLHTEEAELPERHFVYVDHRHLRPDLRVAILRESDVGDTEGSPDQRLRIVVRRLIDEAYHEGHRNARKPLTTREADLTRWAWALMRAMGGPS